MTDRDVHILWRGAFDFAYHRHDPRLAGDFAAWVVESEHDSPSLGSVPPYPSLYRTWEDECGSSLQEKLLPL